MGALFAFGARTAVMLLGALALLGTAAAQGATGRATCGADHIDRRARVAYVYDGDTVRLADGTHVRFIGINAPEIAHDGNPAQPFGDAARRAVVALLRANPEIGLRYGATRHDRYGRTLAHLYLADGRSLEAVLLARGLATTLVMPPDVWHQGCYGRVQAQARKARRGIWGLAAYRPVASTALRPNAEGYRLVRGRVVHVGRSRNALWLDLAGDVALRIPRADLHYFRGLGLEGLKGRRVLARGWLHRHGGELRMNLRYPSALNILP